MGRPPGLIPINFSPEARQDLERETRWWRENRPMNPSLFREELESIMELLAQSPSVGLPQTSNNQPVRILMRRVRCHVYYIYDERANEVLVVAVWGAHRSKGPPSLRFRR